MHTLLKPVAPLASLAYNIICRKYTSTVKSKCWVCFHHFHFSRTPLLFYHTLRCSTGALILTRAFYIIAVKLYERKIMNPSLLSCKICPTRIQSLPFFHHLWKFPPCNNEGTVQDPIPRNSLPYEKQTHFHIQMPQQWHTPLMAIDPNLPPHHYQHNNRSHNTNLQVLKQARAQIEEVQSLLDSDIFEIAIPWLFILRLRDEFTGSWHLA